MPSTYTSWLDYTQQVAPQVTNRDLQIQFMYWGYAEAHLDNTEHRHSFYEACYVVQGTGRFQCDGTWHTLSPGDVFLARPGVPHQIVSVDKNMELYWVAYDWKTLSPTLDSDAQLLRNIATSETVITRDDGRVYATWLALRSVTDTLRKGTKQQVEGLAQALITAIAQLMSSASWSPEIAPPRDSESALMRQAVLYIRDNLAKELSISEVSSHVSLSYRHFSRLFTKHMGCSFVQYVNQSRIEMAAALLHNPSYTVKQAAKETGFHDIHYFTRLFTRTMGLPPAKYRTTNQCTYVPPISKSGEYR